MSTELSSEDRQLLEQIIAALKAQAHYMQFFDEDDTAGINKVRALGRRAGRELQWKVHTSASDPDGREDRRIGVLVYVEESSPLHQELMDIRHEKKSREVADKMDKKARRAGLDALLDRPATHRPRLERLFAEPSIFTPDA